MGHGDNSKYSNKHPEGSSPDALIAERLKKVEQNGRVSCVDAHRIAGALEVPSGDVGRTMDLMDLRIAACQLGLFGYQPLKRIVKPAAEIPPEIESQIRSRLVNGRLSCLDAWDIADNMGMDRLKVAEVCEALGIKIIRCQLGAF